MLKCSQYLYGRSKLVGYSMNKYTYDRPTVPQWVLGQTRAKGVGRDFRVMELIREDGRTVLSNAEMVTTEDVYEGGVLKETIPTRPYNYTQYIFPDLADVHGCEAFRCCLEMMIYPPLMLDKHTYQLESEEPGGSMSGRMLTGVPYSALQAAYREAVRQSAEKRQQDAASAPEDFRKGGAESFSREQLGTLAAELWRKAYRSVSKHETEAPLLLLTTAPWRYELNLADENTVIREGVIFLHDALAPLLPDGVADLLSVTFSDSGFAQRGCERSTVKVCVPENSLYQDQDKELFCPFEGQIYGYRPWRGVAALGSRLAKGMPESYRLLAGNPAAEADYDLALAIVETEDACSAALDADNALNTAQRLTELHEQLHRHGIAQTEAARILRPLHQRYIAACGRLRLDAKHPLIGQWMDLNAIFTEDPDMNADYVALLQQAMVSGRRAMLGKLSKRSDAAYYPLETAIIRSMQTAEGDELPSIVKRAQHLMQTGADDALASACLELAERSVAAGLPAETRACIRITPRRKQALREGVSNAAALVAELQSDALAAAPAGKWPGDTALALFKLYGRRKEDADLAAAIESCMLTQTLACTGHQAVLETYLAGEWRHPDVENAIVNYICSPAFYGSFREEKSWQKALEYTSVFLNAEDRQKRYADVFGKALVNGMIQLQDPGERCPARILHWPVSGEKIGEAIAIVLEKLQQKLPQDQRQAYDRTTIIAAFRAYEDMAAYPVSLREGYETFAGLNLSEHPAQYAARYGRMLLKDTGCVVPALQEAMNGRSVNWRRFLEEAYPLKGKGWEHVDLFSSRTNAWGILNMLLEEFPEDCDAGSELRRQMSSWPCFCKAVDTLHKRMPKLDKMDETQLIALRKQNQLLHRLMYRVGDSTLFKGGDVQ